MPQSRPRPHAVPAARQTPPGVTLVELLVVIVVIGIVSAIALPRLNTAAFDADAGARGVTGTLMRGQRTAMQRQAMVNVGFDTSGRRLRIVEDSNANGVFEDLDRVTWQPLAEKVAFAGAPPAALPGAPTGTGAVRGSELRDVLGLPSVTFMRHGAATGDVVVYLHARARGRTETRAVAVSQGTGRADAFRLVDGAWRRGGM